MERIVYLTCMLFALLGGCQKMNQKEPSKLPRIQVILGKSISSLEGKEWPTYTDGRPFELMLVQEPCDMFIRLPSGTELNFKARNADLNQENSTVHSIKVRFPVEPLDYDEALTALEADYSRISRTRDSGLASELESWKNKKPIQGWPDTRMTRTDFENGVKLELGVESVYYNNTNKWVGFLTFYLPGRA